MILTTQLANDDASPQIDINSDSTEVPTFNTSNWNVYQYFDVSANDDDEAGPGRKCSRRIT